MNLRHHGYRGVLINLVVRLHGWRRELHVAELIMPRVLNRLPRKTSRKAHLFGVLNMPCDTRPI